MNKITLIKPHIGFQTVNLKELFSFKSLIWCLMLKDIKIRYKQMFFGGFWALLKPCCTMLILTVFFGKIGKLPSDGFPYAVFSYSGLILWIYFSSTVSSTSNSLINNAGLIGNLYFPRIIIPLYTSLVGVVDYLIAFGVVFILLIYYQVAFSFSIFLVPLILFFTWLLALGLGFWFSSFNLKYRDVSQLLPFFLQLSIFISPIIYPISMVSEKYRWLLLCNPLTGLINTHRALILGNQAIDFIALGISLIITLIVFVSGIFYFKAVEKYFADLL